MTRRPASPRAAFALLVPAVALAVHGLSPAAGGGKGPPKVTVAHPVIRQVSDYVDFTGRLEAAQKVDLRARVTGALTKVRCRPGMAVKKGELLFEIDPRPYQIEVAKAEAEVRRAEIRARRGEDDLKRARALMARGAMSREDFDQIVSRHAEAEAGLKAVRARLDLARLYLDFTRVSAPLAGRVSAQVLDEGNVVLADTTLLTTLVSVDPICAYFDVDQRTLLRLRKLKMGPRIPVRIGLPDEERFPHRGQVDVVGDQVDPGTGAARWRAALPNPKDELLPGMFVRVRLPAGAPHKALLIPEQALGTDQGRKFVYVVTRDNKVDERRVQVGQVHDGFRAIVAGVEKDDQVIVRGLHRVRPGMTVQPEPQAAKPETPK